MSLPLTNFLKSAPPTPRVVLLPDALFFTRTLAVPAGATAADVAAEVELALETLSPFPPAQLYHGFYWPEGADRALVFAAYRRRFTADQVAEWDTAELVIPSFAALLGGSVQPGTTVLVPSDEGLTALYWDQSPVPERVRYLPIPAGAADAERAQVRDELVRFAPQNRVVVLGAAPFAEPGLSDREYAFRAEAFASTLPARDASSADVRDKEALASLRRAHGRDLTLWRVFLGLLVLLVLLALGEFALMGGRVWLRSLTTQVNAQRPVVERIMTAQNLTTRINELSTKRLLPFEMIGVVMQQKPETVTFLRTTTNGLYGLNIDAYTTTPAAASTYQTALRANPAIATAEVRDQRTRDNQMTFTLAVTFKPDALRPASPNP